MRGSTSLRSFLSLLPLASVVLLAGLSGCQPPTTFHGEAKFPTGPRGCYDKCQAWQMDMVGMVAIGDYSEACICRWPARPAPAQPASTPSAGVQQPTSSAADSPDDEDQDLMSVGGQAAAAVAVRAMMDAQEEAARQQQNQWQQQQLMQQQHH